jgi:hypothetical protein
MGLDNGIYITNSEGVDSPYSMPIGDETELCYWRKCWGIRNEIMDYLQTSAYEIELNDEDVSHIIGILKKFKRRKYWDANARSIWEYDEIKRTLKQQIEKLQWLLKIWPRHPDIKCFFYDSY